MSQNRECSATPKLRFPDFQNAPAWAAQSIGRILTESRIPSSQSSPDRRITVRLHGQGVQRREYRGTESLDATRHFTRKAGQFIYGKQNIHKGAFGIIPPELDGFETSQDLPAFDFSDNYCSRWFLYYLSREHYYTALEKKMTGTGSKRLSEEVFLTQPIFVPTKREQQKIAECLSTLDELIEAENRKLDALKNHKKGLMQQLFPREGETRPRLRDPAFRNAPEWQEQPLEALAKRGSGHTPSKAHPEYYNGGIKWVSLADSHRLDNGFIRETEIEISQQGIENSSACLHPKGSVLLSRDAGIGKSAVMASDMAVSQHFIVWTCDSTKLNNWFLYHLFQHMKPLFERVATGSTIKTIGLPFFINLQVTIPSPKEQERIALCLNALDDLIAAQIAKLEGVRTHKRGLMQQLFPNPCEFES